MPSVSYDNGDSSRSSSNGSAGEAPIEIPANVHLSVRASMERRRSSIALTDLDKTFPDVPDPIQKECRKIFDSFDVTGIKTIELGDVQKALASMNLKSDLEYVLKWMEKGVAKTRRSIFFQRTWTQMAS